MDEKLLIGAKFPLYYSLRYLDMEKQNKTLIYKTLISKYHFINYWVAKPSRNLGFISWVFCYFPCR